MGVRLATDVRYRLTYQGSELPLERIEIIETKRRFTASVTLRTIDNFWAATGFDLDQHYTRLERVITETGGTETVELLAPRMGADTIASLPISADTFRVEFTDAVTLELRRPVAGNYSGFFDPHVLALSIITGANTGLTVTADPYVPAFVTPPPVTGYPTLPNSRIVITATTHPGGPMDEPTFAALVNYCDSQGEVFADSNGGFVFAEDYLYADEAGGGSLDTGNVGPWDEADIESPPFANNQALTVVHERYVVETDGTLARETLIDRAGDGSPPFTIPVFNRSVSCPAPVIEEVPDGHVQRDIKAARCRTVTEEIESLMDEIGFEMIIDRAAETIHLGARPATVDVVLSSTTNIADDPSPVVHPGAGRYSIACVEGVDGVFARTEIPQTIPRVRRGRAQSSDSGVLGRVALNLLTTSGDDEPTYELTLRAGLELLDVVGGLTTDQVPDVGDTATVDVAALDPFTLAPIGHLADSSTAGREITERRLVYGPLGFEQISLQIGNGPRSTQDALEVLLRGVG